MALCSAGRYVDALNILEQQCDDIGFSNPSRVLKRYESNERDFEQQNILGIITDVLLRCSRYHDALVFASHASDTISDEKSKLRLAECYNYLGEYDRVLAILTSESDDIVPEMLLELSEANARLKNLEIAEQQALKALQIYYNEVCSEKSYNYYGELISANDSQRIFTALKPDLIKCKAEARLNLLRYASPSIIECLRQLRLICWYRNNHQLDKAYGDKIQQLLPQVYGQNALVHISARYNNSQAAHFDDIGEYEKSEKMYMKALSLYEEMYGSDTNHADIALVLSNLGVLYNRTTDYCKAEAYSKRALDMYRCVYGEKSVHHDIIRVIRIMGIIYKLQRDYKQAEEWDLKPVDMLTQHHHPQTDHRDIADALKRLGNFYKDIKRYDDAHKHLNKSLEMYQRIHGPNSNHEDIAELLLDMGSNCDCNSDHSTALEYSLRALDMYREVYGKDACRADIARALHNIGVSYHNMNEYVTAEEYYTQALTMNRKVYGEESNNETIALTLRDLGDVKRQLKMYDEAEKTYQESLQMYRQIYGCDSNHRDIALVLALCADDYRDEGEKEKAIAMYEESLLMYREVEPDHENVQLIIQDLKNLGVQV